MISDLANILIWWLYLLGIGLIFLPLTRKIFANFFDQGYLFSKVLAVLFSSYLVWFLALLKILPFYQETIWLVLILGMILNFWLLKKNQIFAPNYKLPITNYFFLEELMFLGTLIFWSYIRGFQPDIQGLEKFMDYGFVNSILRSRFFPPADMWFAGKSINYYYYGHYVTAFLTKLTGIPSAITYNLMIATLFAFCFSLTFCLTSNLLYLWKKNLKLVIFGGLITALLISLSANLHPAYYNFKMKILRKPYCNGSYFYWYPDATRYIGYCPDVDDKTIHEFPSYSFIVSDLHGHVSDIPFVLTFLALSFILLQKIREKKYSILQLLITNYLITISLLLSVMFMTNQWDYPIYLMVLGLSLWFGLYLYYKNPWQSFKRAVFHGIVFVLISIPFFLPFQLNFEPITKGVALVWKHSLPHQLLILWGGPWFFGVTFIIFLFGGKIKTGLKKESIIKWLADFVGVKVEIKSDKSQLATSPPSPPAGGFGGASNQQLTIPDIFVLILFLVSTILIIIPEIIYVKDIYIPSYHRANTMFKLTYQSFVMFSVSVGYVFIRVTSCLKRGLTRNLLFTFYSLLFTFLMVYPIYSIPGYYGKMRNEDYRGLYGLSFLQRLYSDDYRAILWLNENISGQPVILEAVGDSYTDYERISMATGLPTIEGWLVHEWLWRGSFDEPGKRASEVQQIYETKDSQIAKDILSRYLVRFVIIGEMERRKYPNLEERKFNQLGEIVFQEGSTTIYQIE